jgi:hypothetical protein
MLLCARFTRKFSPSITSMGWQQQQQQEQQEQQEQQAGAAVIMMKQTAYVVLLQPDWHPRHEHAADSRLL